MTAVARASQFALPTASARPQASSFTVEAIRDLAAAEAIWRELRGRRNELALSALRLAEGVCRGSGREPRLRAVRAPRPGRRRPPLPFDPARHRAPAGPLRRGRDRRQARELPPAAHGRGRGAALAVRAPHPAAAGRPPARHRRLCLHEPAAVLARRRQSARLRRTAEPQQRLPPHPRRERRGDLARALSKDARKKLRQKDKKLRERGPVVHRVAGTSAEIAPILSAFLTQKRDRFRATRIPDPFADAATQSFLERACLAGLSEARPAIELHALTMGERVLATFGAAVDATRCCGMFTSFDADPEIARSSPGELLMLEVIRHQCAEGRRVFDLGVGEARYKSSLCDEVEELVDVSLPVTARGHLYVAAFGGFLRLKRLVKQTPWLWQGFTRLRSRLGASSSGAGDLPKRGTA